jgi:hypothetical protein
MHHLIYEGSYRQFAGIIFIDERKTKTKKPRTMGQTIGLLGNFSFPDKDAILLLFQSISKGRNNLFHNLAKIDEDSAEILDKDMNNIKLKTEELLDKINVVYTGLQKILVDEEKPATNEGGK